MVRPHSSEATLTQALSTTQAALQELGYSLSSPEVRSAMQRHEASIRQHYLREFQNLVSELRATKGAGQLFRKYMDSATRCIGPSELQPLMPELGLDGESEDAIISHYSGGRGKLDEVQFCHLYADTLRFAQKALPTKAVMEAPLLPPPPRPRSQRRGSKKAESASRDGKGASQEGAASDEPSATRASDELIALRAKVHALQKQLDEAKPAPVVRGEIDGPPVIVAQSSQSASPGGAAKDAPATPKPASPKEPASPSSAAHSVFAMRDLEKKLKASEAEVSRLKARVLRLSSESREDA